MQVGDEFHGLVECTANKKEQYLILNEAVVQCKEFINTSKYEQCIWLMSCESKTVNILVSRLVNTCFEIRENLPSKTSIYMVVM